MCEHLEGEPPLPLKKKFGLAQVGGGVQLFSSHLYLDEIFTQHRAS